MLWIAKLRNLCQALGQFRRAKKKRASEKRREGWRGDSPSLSSSPHAVFRTFFRSPLSWSLEQVKKFASLEGGWPTEPPNRGKKAKFAWNFIKFRGEVIKLKAIEFLLIAKQIMLAVKASWLASKTSTCFNNTENWIWNQLYFVLSAYSNKDLHKSFWKFSFHGYWVYWYGLTLRYN